MMTTEDAAGDAARDADGPSMRRIGSGSQPHHASMHAPRPAQGTPAMKSQMKPYMRGIGTNLPLGGVEHEFALGK